MKILNIDYLFNTRNEEREIAIIHMEYEAVEFKMVIAIKVLLILLKNNQTLRGR